MLTSSDLPEPAIGAAPSLEVMGEGNRRLAHRFKTAFRASCLIAGGRAHIAMIKNMSRMGVMVELAAPLRVGQSVHYFWDEKQVIAARVVWSEGNRHGLANEEEQTVFDSHFRYRSVRVPCSGEAEVWIEGALRRPIVKNVSLGGAQLSGLLARPGSLLTLRFSGVELTNACVRWSHDARDGAPAQSGVAFAERLTASQLNSLLGASPISVPTPDNRARAARCRTD